MAKKKKAKRAVKKAAKRAAEKPARRAATKRSAPKQTSRKVSVDALLKQFATQRAVTEGQLAALHKNKEALEKTAAKINEQLEKLSAQQRKLEGELAGFDAQRDQQVSQLLATLGVQVREQGPLSVYDESDQPPPESRQASL